MHRSSFSPRALLRGEIRKGISHKKRHPELHMISMIFMMFMIIIYYYDIYLTCLFSLFVHLTQENVGDHQLELGALPTQKPGTQQPRRKEFQGSPVVGMRKKLVGTTHHMMTHGLSACWVVLSHGFANFGASAAEKHRWCSPLEHRCILSPLRMFENRLFHVYVLPSISHWQ